MSFALPRLWVPSPSWLLDPEWHCTLFFLISASQRGVASPVQFDSYREYTNNGFSWDNTLKWHKYVHFPTLLPKTYPEVGNPNLVVERLPKPLGMSLPPPSTPDLKQLYYPSWLWFYTKPKTSCSLSDLVQSLSLFQPNCFTGHSLCE